MDANPFNLHNDVVFLTGASGGLGGAMLKAFVDHGAYVAAYARRPVPASQQVMSLTGDIRDPTALDAAMHRVIEQWGRVDACIVNAGIWPSDALPLDKLSEQRIRDVIETNLLGAIWTVRAFLTALRQCRPRSDGRGASIVFIGSTAGRFGERGHAEYAASKAALRGLMLSLKNEVVLIDPKARVNLIEPGWTTTPMVDSTLQDSALADRAMATMALRQLATPDDIAAAVLFLCSSTLSRHISGETLTIAGGMEGRLLW